jgi:hypothetical protein
MENIIGGHRHYRCFVMRDNNKKIKKGGELSINFERFTFGFTSSHTNAHSNACCLGYKCITLHFYKTRGKNKIGPKKYWSSDKHSKSDWWREHKYPLDKRDTIRIVLLISKLPPMQGVVY